MVLFQVFRGLSENLPQNLTDGCVYLTTDDGKLYIDTATTRFLINPDVSSAEQIAYSKDGVITNVAAVLDGLLQTSASIENHTTEYWNNHSDVISGNHTFYVYSDGYTYTTTQINGQGEEVQVTKTIPKIKVGDGTSYVSDLPFLDDDIRLALLQHINNTNAHVTSEQKTFWNEKLNIDDQQEIVGGALIFNRN